MSGGRIERQVAENREGRRRLDGRFIDLPETANRNLSFARNVIEVEVSLEIYTRSLATGLYSGHPSEAHGSGRGEAGDLRGEWVLETDETVSALFVRQGRNAVRDALAGETGALAEAAVGTDETGASVGDSALGNETGRTSAYGIKDESTVTRGRSHFLFAEDGLAAEGANEFALFDTEGRILNRLTTTTVNVGESEEIRVDISMEVTGDGTGNSVVTEDGREAIADSIRSRGVVIGLNELAFGQGETPPEETDTGLDDEVYRRTVGRERDNERITVDTNTPSAQPDAQPVDLPEVGVFDNADPPRLVWRVVMDAMEKTEDFGFGTSVSFRIR